MVREMTRDRGQERQALHIQVPGGPQVEPVAERRGEPTEMEPRD